MLKPREIFTQATSPNASSGSPNRSNSYFEGAPPFGQPPGVPVAAQPPQLPPPTQPAYQQQQFQQYQQHTAYPNTSPYPFSAQQPTGQVPSPTSQSPPTVFGGQQPYPPTNTPGTNPYASYQHQSLYPQGAGPSPPPQPQGAYTVSGAPPQAPPYTISSTVNQDPNSDFSQELKSAPVFSPPATNTPPAPPLSPPVANPSPSPFPAVRDPYVNHNNQNNGNMAYTQQPGAGPVMVIDARNAKNMPRDAAGEREWSNGLCSCMDDCGTCKFSDPLSFTT